MRVGDIGGLDDIYDNSGKLILKQGEQVLRKVENDNIDVYRGKFGLTARTLLGHTKEKGTLYLTDRRLVFIRNPDPWLAFQTYGTPFELATGLGKARYARDLKSLGLRSFVEISYSEVRSFRSKKGKWAELRLEDSDGVLVRVDLDRCGKEDDKIALLNNLLKKAGARELS